jgi:hypothetical protein
MTRKYYRAPSNITVSVSMLGVPKTISFFPQIVGSLYITENSSEQESLESNPWFGDKYVLEKVEKSEDKPKKEKYEVKENQQNKTISVASISDAQEYLMKEFHASEKQLTSKKKIKAFAKEKNIEFVGL